MQVFDHQQHLRGGAPFVQQRDEQVAGTDAGDFRVFFGEIVALDAIAEKVEEVGNGLPGIGAENLDTATQLVGGGFLRLAAEAWRNAVLGRDVLATSNAARQARNGASSIACGAPNNAITPSPTKSCVVPPYALTASTMRCMRVKVSSSPSFSASAV